MTKPLIIVLGLSAAAQAAPVLIAPTPVYHPSLVSVFDHMVASPEGLVARIGSTFSIDRVDTTWVQTSTDRGRTWLPPVALGDFAGGHLSVAGNNLVDVFAGYGSSSFLMRSTDGGSTFKTGPMVESQEVRDVVTSRTGTVARIETFYLGGGRVATSTDDGASWRTASLEGARAGAWTGDDDLLVCWIDDVDPAQPTYCRRSRNSGLDFAPAVAVSLPAGNEPGQWNFRVTSGASGEAFLLNGHALAHTTDGGDTWSAVDLGSSVGWLDLASRTGEAWVLGHDALLRTTDGTTLVSVALPANSWSCQSGESGWANTIALVDSGAAMLAPYLLRTEDAGLTWSEPDTSTSNVPLTIDDAELVRLPSGGLVALWSSFAGTSASIRSSFSTDGGLTWSPVAAVNDRARSTKRNDRGFAAAVTPAGEVVVAWHSTAGEFRTTTTRDGALTWSPSAFVAADPPVGCSGSLPAGNLSIVSDGAGRLVVSWLAGFAHMARSSDGGSNWSPDEPIALNSKGLIPPVRTADGGLAVGLRTVEEWNAFGRSSDGGATWDFEVVPTASSAWAPANFLASPQRIFAAEHHRCWYRSCRVNENVESRDGGHTWTMAGTYLNGSLLLAGDDAGYGYWRRTSEAVTGPYTNAVVVIQPRGPTVEYPQTADWPLGRTAAIALAPLELGVVRAIDTPAADTPVAGIYYEVLKPGPQQVLRDFSITSLDPRPDIAGRFPLPFADLDATSPWVDDGVRDWPQVDTLVFYQVATAGSATLKIVKGPNGQPSHPLAVTLTW